MEPERSPSLRPLPAALAGVHLEERRGEEPSPRAPGAPPNHCAPTALLDGDTSRRWPGSTQQPGHGRAATMHPGAAVNRPTTLPPRCLRIPKARGGCSEPPDTPVLLLSGILRIPLLPYAHPFLSHSYTTNSAVIAHTRSLLYQDFNLAAAETPEPVPKAANNASTPVATFPLSAPHVVISQRFFYFYFSISAAHYLCGFCYAATARHSRST